MELLPSLILDSVLHVQDRCGDFDDRTPVLNGVAMLDTTPWVLILTNLRDPEDKCQVEAD